MAVNAYLTIEGVDGPSTSRPKAIEIFSFSFGASQPTSVNEGALRAGKAALSELHIMKALDKTSPILFEHCVSGNFFKKVELLYGKAMGDKQEDYFKLELTDCMISNLQFSGSSENPSESLSMAFQKIKVSYNAENSDGKLAGWVDKGYDVTTLKPF